MIYIITLSLWFIYTMFFFRKEIFFFFKRQNIAIQIHQNSQQKDKLLGETQTPTYDFFQMPTQIEIPSEKDTEYEDYEKLLHPEEEDDDDEFDEDVLKLEDYSIHQHFNYGVDLSSLNASMEIVKKNINQTSIAEQETVKNTINQILETELLQKMIEKQDETSMKIEAIINKKSKN